LWAQLALTQACYRCRRVADTLNNMADVHYAQKRPNEARVMYEEALRIYLEAYGQHHVEVANTLVGLGPVLCGQVRIHSRIFDRPLLIIRQEFTPSYYADSPVRRSVGQQHPLHLSSASTSGVGQRSGSPPARCTMAGHDLIPCKRSL
jgi:hypothetical protein